MKEVLINKTTDTGKATLLTIQKATKFNQWMYKTIKPFLKGDVLEIGSGLGNISRFVIKDNYRITLSDINSEYCEILHKDFLKYNNVTEVLSIDLAHPDFITHYENLKKKYDTIFLLNVIEHIHDDQSAISNCHWMLRSGGHLIVLAPAYPFLFSRLDKELGHYRRYTRKTLPAIFDNSLFNILSSRYFNLAGIFGWFFFGNLLGRKQIGSGEMSAFEKLTPLFRLLDRLVFYSAGLSIIVTARKK